MEQLQPFRRELNQIDEALVELLGKRFAIIREVGHYKKAHGIPMMQHARVEEVKERCAALGENHQLDKQFMRDLYGLIIDEACRLEDTIIDDE